MKNIFFFESMLTTKIITLVYWFFLTVILLSGIITIFSNFSAGALAIGIGGIVVCAIFVRIWCELMIVVFKIHENLSTLVDLKKESKS